MDFILEDDKVYKMDSDKVKEFMEVEVEIRR